jgi:hypothetical protein
VDSSSIVGKNNESFTKTEDPDGGKYFECFAIYIGPTDITCCLVKIEMLL